MGWRVVGRAVRLGKGRLSNGGACPVLTFPGLIHFPGQHRLRQRHLLMQVQFTARPTGTSTRAREEVRRKLCCQMEARWGWQWIGQSLNRQGFVLALSNAVSSALCCPASVSSPFLFRYLIPHPQVFPGFQGKGCLSPAAAMNQLGPAPAELLARVSLDLGRKLRPGNGVWTKCTPALLILPPPQCGLPTPLYLPLPCPAPPQPLHWVYLLQWTVIPPVGTGRLQPCHWCLAALL